MRRGLCVLSMIVIVSKMMFTCSSRSSSDKYRCTIQEVDLSEMIADSEAADADSFLFDITNHLQIDSVFIYGPYTPIGPIEQRLQCNFKNELPIEDDTWCLIVIKDLDSDLKYSIVSRRFDLAPLIGKYGKSDIKPMFGIRKGERYVFSFYNHEN